MTARIRRRRSRLAVWSWRLALLGLAVLAGGALAHRLDRIDSPALFVLLAVGFSLAGLAVLCGVLALKVIWQHGHGGLGAGLRGLVLGMVLLGPAIVSGYLVMARPRLADISTDLVDPPAFAMAAEARRGALARLDPALQRAAYPDILAQRFDGPPAAVFDAVERLAAARGWQVLDARPPTEPGAEARLEAVARTDILGFRDDVVIRLQPDDGATRVDIRSASRYGSHDLGTNAARIRAFQVALEASLAGLPSD